MVKPFLKSDKYIKKLGVYQFKDREGNIIFVGRSAALRRRLVMYLKDPNSRDRLPALLLTTKDASTVTTGYNRYMPELKEKAKQLPTQPGVYLFKDKDGKVIYVGKAKNLRNRVTQYFGTHDTRPQLPYLMAEAQELDYTVVDTELESLFLENTLIKQYLPQYNIKLRDDKNYAFIKIDYATQIPQIGYARKVDNDRKSARYFGPYSSARKIKHTLDFVRRIFPYCANKEIGKRPCFYYYLHRCPGVCTGEITLEEYAQQLDRIMLFLSGKTQTIKSELKTLMNTAAKEHLFERAGKLRDQLQSLEVLEEKQITMFPAQVDWDFISVFRELGTACVNVFKVREGKLIDKENFIYQDGKGFALEGEIIQSFMESYYAEASDLPREIYIEAEIENPHLIEQLLKGRVKHKIGIAVPTRSKKLQLIKLGKTNAREFLQKWQTSQATNRDVLNLALESLKELLQLPTLPRRIEGYDISNIQGTNPVGSMVVAVDGLAAKSEYRKFKINIKQTPDDFAMMREMLERRLARLPGIHENEKEAWPLPDLLVIDGGKPQLGIAVSVLKERDLNIPVIGLAKRIEEIFVPGKSEPIILPHDNSVLQLLQRLRDEAHRFGITFHRSLRSKAAVRSALDEIPGIGPKTKKILKDKYGTVSRMREVTLEELTNLVGAAKAEIIKKGL